MPYAAFLLAILAAPESPASRRVALSAAPKSWRRRRVRAWARFSLGLPDGSGTDPI